MNHLILGGAGFLGQHLTKALFNQKERHVGVTVVDNFSTGKLDREQFAVYKNLYRVVEGDLATMSKEELLGIVRKHDKIWHLAGSVGVDYIDKNPSETLFNNAKLNYNLVQFFQEAKRPVVFFSTSEIYGDGPFGEEDFAHIAPTSKLRGGYAASKLMAEFMIRASNFPYTIVRIFNAVGPGQVGDYGMVLPRFINAAKNNEDIVVYGTGEQVRSFCHVDDTIRAVIGVSDIYGELFNIGNDEPITINRLAERVINLSRSSSKIVHIPYEQAFTSNHIDINYRVPNIDKLRSAINYEPTKSLDYIIRDML